MRLYFVRHGQSTNNVLWEETGSSFGRSEDPPLTEKGVQQAITVGSFLSQRSPDGGSLHPFSYNHHNITYIYSSLMVRAVATGMKIAEKLDLPLTAWEDIHEAGGIYLDDIATGQKLSQPGKDRQFFEINYPKLILPPWLNDKGWWRSRPPEGRADVLPRAQRVVSELIRRHGQTDDQVVMVSHGDFYQSMMAVLLNIKTPIQKNGLTDHIQMPNEANHLRQSIPQNYWFWLSNAAVTRIDITPEHTDFVYMNRTDFMPNTLIS